MEEYKTREVLAKSSLLGEEELAKKYHKNQKTNLHEKNQASTSTVNKIRNKIVLFKKMTTKIS
ncbi:MAG: hypothetical protein WDM78_14435 [Puia sp.]